MSHLTPNSERGERYCKISGLETYSTMYQKFQCAQN